MYKSISSSSLNLLNQDKMLILEFMETSKIWLNCNLLNQSEEIFWKRTIRESNGESLRQHRKIQLRNPQRKKDLCFRCLRPSKQSWIRHLTRSSILELFAKPDVPLLVLIDYIHLHSESIIIIKSYPRININNGNEEHGFKFQSFQWKITWSQDILRR